MIVMAVLSTIISLVSFAGYVSSVHLPSRYPTYPIGSHRFFGAIFKKVGGIRAFARVLAWLLGIQFVFSVLYIVAILVEPKSEFIKQCEQGNTDSNVTDVCTNKIQEVKIITIAIIVVGLLLHSCKCTIPLFHPILFVVLTVLL